MDKGRKRDLRAAVVASAMMYAPIALAIGLLVPKQDLLAAANALGVSPTPAALAVPATLVVLYFLAVDAVLPLGRSKMQILRDLAKSAKEALLREDAWYLRVGVMLAMTLVVEIVSEIPLKH